MKINYIVDKKNSELTLKQVLKQTIQISSSLYREVINNGSVLVNGKTIYSRDIVKEGDTIIIDLNKTLVKRDNKRINKKSNLNNQLKIVYEDEYIIAIDKQSGIAAHPCLSYKDNTLYNQVEDYYLEKGYDFQIHMVNRLDRNTSGLCIIAKHKYVQELLSKNIKYGSFTKEYIAIVYGKMKNKHGTLEGNIARKEGSIILRQVSENGDISKTEYFTESYNKEKNYSVLRIILHTGRTHQIRVHMSDIGHPIIGDELYINETKEKYDIKNICEDIDRQALHAKTINIKLDILNLDVVIEAEVPEDMKRLM